jgi:LDH2 family malate/lactate/ureidoglycolate dehydrogenase
MESNASAESTSIVRVNRANLSQLVVKLLQRKGMFVAEAEIVANRSIEADQCGQFRHGVGSLPQYLDAMDVGDIDPRARIITLSETPAVALLDGSTGIGHVAATRAMLFAIEKARAVGTGTIVIKNSRLCGDVGGIARLAAEVGLIGFVTNSFAERVVNDVGDHALAWGLPVSAGSEPRIVRDYSLNLGEASSLVLGLLSAGLAGGEALSRKRKTARVADTVEHFVQAIDPDKYASRDTLLAKWGPTLAATQPTAAAASRDDAADRTVPLQFADARALAELAARIKFEITW